MDHYIITSYEDMAKERFAELQKQAAIQRRVKEAKQALPRKPGFVARLAASSLTLARAIWIFGWSVYNRPRRRYAKRAI